MESNRPPSPAAARAALASAEAARERLAGRLELPAGFGVLLAVCAAIHLATAGLGIAVDAWWAHALLAAGIVVVLSAGGVLAWRFRRRNGVWVAGLLDNAVLGLDPLASVVYVVALGLAIAAASAEQWVMLGIVAATGGAGYAAAGRRWFARYQAEPQAHARGLSPVASIGAAALAAAGLLVLVLVLSR